MNFPALLRAAVAALALAAALPAAAEPYFAVESGLKCAQCHANPTGGGLRTAFGNVWAQTQMAARRLGPDDAAPWTGQVVDFLAIGGNARFDARYVDVPGRPATNAFETEEARAYLQAALIPGRLFVSLDERVAPGNATNMEAALRLASGDGGRYVKAGRFYLPFGWRLEDDNALVRRLSGINMQAPDEGLELGLETDRWSAQVALTNGTAGAPERDTGKQVVARLEHVRADWRLGASALFNDTDGGTRKAAALFAGLRLGPTHWLAEIDFVDDGALGPAGREQSAALLEANWRMAPGHNLKLSHGWLDPDTDTDEDEETRTSLLHEWSPIQFLQLRSGVRVYDGPRENDLVNRTEAFVQLHAYF